MGVSSDDGELGLQLGLGHWCKNAKLQCDGALLIQL